jgi:hypothetical protein
LKKAFQAPQPNASASYTHALAFISFKTVPKDFTFVIDLAASHHTIHNRSIFTSFSTETIIIKAKSRTDKLRAEGVGDISVLTNRYVVHLCGCLFLPHISQQLVLLV